VKILNDRHERQLKKGALEIIILRLIKRRPSYGYELLTELERKSGRFFSLREGTLYPILYRLEDEGLIRAQWNTGESRGTPKKIYAITPKGRETLEQLCQVWKQFSKSVNDLLFEEDSFQ
jgi:PadR family transcriptional regulator PadR